MEWQNQPWVDSQIAHRDSLRTQEVAKLMY